MILEETLTYNQLAQYLRVSRSQLLRVRRSGGALPPGFTVGQKKLYYLKDVDTWRFEQEKLWEEIFKHVPKRAA